MSKIKEDIPDMDEHEHLRVFNDKDEYREWERQQEELQGQAIDFSLSDTDPFQDSSYIENTTSPGAIDDMLARIGTVEGVVEKAKTQIDEDTKEIREIQAQIRLDKQDIDTKIGQINITIVDVDSKAKMNLDLMSGVFVVSIITLLGLAFQVWLFLPSYSEKYSQSTEQQNKKIELLENENDDLKKELIYLRSRFDKYIDNSNSVQSVAIKK